MCFAKIKCIWQEVVTKFEQKNYYRVQKDNFVCLFGVVCIQAFDNTTVKAAFAKTGVWPFNYTAISAQQIKPSKYTSTTTTFQDIEMGYQAVTTQKQIQSITHSCRPLVIMTNMTLLIGIRHITC